MPLHRTHGHIIYRLPLLQDHIALEQSSRAVERAREVLRLCPAPNTFLGHKTQEPFPKENDEQ